MQSDVCHIHIQREFNILLRSSWQTVNIGDIAHTPGMLALLEKYHPNSCVTLWPNPLSPEVKDLLTARFPKLRIVEKKDEQAEALARCDFFLHGSGPGLVGGDEVELARKLGKPYGFAGITLSDEELKHRRGLLADAKFIYVRDGASLTALKQANITGPEIGFGPDATFALDLQDVHAAHRLLKKYTLERGKFLCAIPRLRWTPYWEINPNYQPDPAKMATNEAFADLDHAKLREGIIAWVTQTAQPVFLVPEMTYEVPRLRPLLYDPLPETIKKHVKCLDRYWLTAEAAGVYAQAAAVVSFEMHSPIMAIASGVPAVHLRQPTDTRKGQMWRDIGLDKWIFEIDDTSGTQIANCIVEIEKNLPLARRMAEAARTVARQKMREMIVTISNSDGHNPSDRISQDVTTGR